MKIKPAHNKQLNLDGYILDITVNSQRHRQWFATRNEANDAAAQMTLTKRAHKIGLPLPKAARLVSLNELLSARKREMQSLPSWPAAERYLLEFLTFLPCGARLDQVEPVHLARYVESLQSRGLNHNSINLYLSKVGALFNSTKRHFPQCEFTPPHIPYLPPEQTTDRVFAGAEMVRLYRALTNPAALHEREREAARKRRTEQIADLFLACLLTGARPGEIQSLTWSAIGADFDVFTLNATKTGDKRTLPLTKELRALFARRRKLGAATPFAHDLNNATMHRTLFNAGEATGIPYSEQTGWSLKTLRHTAITIMLRARADFLSVQAVVGHSHKRRQSMTLHYAHTSMDGMSEALELLQAFWRKACRDFDRAN